MPKTVIKKKTFIYVLQSCEHHFCKNTQGAKKKIRRKRRFKVIATVQIENRQYQKIYIIEGQNSKEAKAKAITKLKNECGINNKDIRRAFASILKRTYYE